MLSVYKVGVQKNKGSPMLNTTFRKTAAAAALIAATTLSFNVQAQEQKTNTQCSPLEQMNGITLAAGASALIHSEKYPGTVAIATLPGKDLGNSPTLLANVFIGSEVPATCYINDETPVETGSVFTFYVDGLAVKHNGEDQFGLNDILNDRSILSSVANQARVAGQIASLNKDKPTITLASND